MSFPKQKKKKRGPRAAAWCSQVCGNRAAAARGSSGGPGRDFCKGAGPVAGMSNARLTANALEP